MYSGHYIQGTTLCSVFFCPSEATGVTQEGVNTGPFIFSLFFFDALCSLRQKPTGIAKKSITSRTSPFRIKLCPAQVLDHLLLLLRTPRVLPAVRVTCTKHLYNRETCEHDCFPVKRCNQHTKNDLPRSPAVGRSCRLCVANSQGDRRSGPISEHHAGRFCPVHSNSTIIARPQLGLVWCEIRQVEVAGLARTRDKLPVLQDTNPTDILLRFANVAN